MTLKMRFLAVDDDPVFLVVLSHMMQDLGYAAPETAINGREALSKLADQRLKIDCVLLDIHMPDMNGIETCRHIRALTGHEKTPVMMVTTSSNRKSVDFAFAAGATDYLIKPLEKIELAARLGMLQRLVRERISVRNLQNELDSLRDLPGLNFDFDDPVVLPESEMLIDYFALQNHLLTLNRLSMHSNAAIGFQVVGASLMYNRLTPIDYLDYLSYIGRSIEKVMKRHRFRLSHAGRGEFVGVLNRSPAIDPAELEQEIAVQIFGEADIYRALDALTPVVRVGMLQRSGVFSRTLPSNVLEKARQSAQNGHSAYLSQMSA